jgi:hypothetical protein
MIYGKTFLNESVNRNRRDSSLSLLESVAFDEYQNRVTMLESCKDEHTRSLIEAQIEVLREVSLKDIKDKFLAFLKKIGDFIKKIIDKIKSFFNKDDKKKQEEELKIVKKKLEEANLMNEKLKKENFEQNMRNMDNEHELNSELIQAKRDLQKRDRELDAANKKLSNANNALDKKDKELNAANTKIKDVAAEKEALTKKLDSVFSKAIENPLLYFNAYNYFRKDLDPVRISRCNVFIDIDPNNRSEGKLSDSNIEQYERKIGEWLDENKKYVQVITDDVKKALLNGEEDNYAKGFSIRGKYYGKTYAPALKEYIANDLQKRVKQAESSTFADVIKNITYVIENNYDSLMEATVDFNEGIANAEKAIDEILSKKSIDETQTDFGNDFQKVHDKLIITGLRTVIAMLKDNVACLAQITLYSAKANGVATATLNTAANVMGIDALKSGASDYTKFVINTALGNN